MFSSLKHVKHTQWQRSSSLDIEILHINTTFTHAQAIIEKLEREIGPCTNKQFVGKGQIIYESEVWSAITAKDYETVDWCAMLIKCDPELALLLRLTLHDKIHK